MPDGWGRLAISGRRILRGRARLNSEPPPSRPAPLPGRALTQICHMSRTILSMWKTVGRKGRLPDGMRAMHRRKSTSQQWSNQSLLRRLAALETEFATDGEVTAKRTDRSRKRRSTAFALGFTTAIIMGAIALVILSLVSPQSAHADARLPMPHVARSASASLTQEAAPGALIAKVVAPSVDLWSGPRELWWGFPKAYRQ
jgi:hypothetical protein